MKLINEDCGCDDDYFSVINNSPLLNGNQEMSFDPSMQDNINNQPIVNKPLTEPIVFERAPNNNINNQIPNVELQAITQNKINNNNIDMNNHNNNNKLNLTAMNNAMNNSMNQGNNPVMNNMAMNSQMNNQMNNPNSLNSMNNINSAQQLNINNDLNILESDDNYKRVVTNVNYILMVVLALAINDVAKYYINRAIKFQNGDHKYYLYYVVGILILTYLVSRMLNKY
jgi:hypothetical protein